MPAQVYQALYPGRITAAPLLPSYMGAKVRRATPYVRPGLRSVSVPYGPIIRAPTFIPRWKSRYSLG